jgi:hypothetical protein
MEYRLNKVDVEIIQKVKDTTKAGIIHKNEGILINKDKKNKEQKQNHDNKSKVEKYECRGNETFTVKAVKYTNDEEYEVDIFKERTKGEGFEKGMLLNTRR